MTTTIFPASNSRPLRLRFRIDLESARRVEAGQAVWIVKDPLRLRYFRFAEEEFQLLQSLDGNRSLSEIQTRFEREFAPRKISTRELERLFGLAHRNGLVVGDGPGQGRVLCQREREERGQQRWTACSNVLAWRYRGIDPDAGLAWLARFTGGLFTWPAMALGVCGGISALALLFSHYAEFCRKLPASGEFFGPENWLPLACTLAAVKILHELGHGVACKRFGGECHEMGVMLLCFTPCLYCDVTDTWMISNKWKRAAVAAAGMYVELWLAGIATWLWWLSEPSWLQALALNVMFVGSVGTVAVNANPLLRYDGYYILSDLWEISNLRGRADAAAQSWREWILLGDRNFKTVAYCETSRVSLVLYAVAAAIYRWGMTVAVLWFLYRLTESAGFKIVGQLLAFGCLMAMFVPPLCGVWRFLSEYDLQGNRERQVKRAAPRLALAGLFLAFFAYFPFPRYVRCEARIQPRDAAHVYVDVPGEIESCFVKPGDWVRVGQPLLRLRNLDLQLQVARLEAAFEHEQARVTALRRQSLVPGAPFDQVSAAEQAALAAKEALVQRRAQLAKLLITAPRDGYVFSAPRRQAPKFRDDLPQWSGHPLEKHNQNAWLAVSDTICTIGDGSQWEALLMVDQCEIDLVRCGQPVDLLLEQQSQRRIATAIEAIAEREKITKDSSDFSAVEKLAPITVSYEALTTFTEQATPFAAGGEARARIYVGKQSSAVRALREFQRVFHWEL